MDVETLRKICLFFPGAKEDIKWEHDLAFTVGEKMFAVTSFDEPFKCSLKVADDQFDEYISKEGFEPALPGPGQMGADIKREPDGQGRMGKLTTGEL